MGEDSFGINRQTIEAIVAEIAQVSRLGVEIGVVIGGGNMFRGVVPGASGMVRATADYMGMLATVMNALALQDAMRHAGLASRALSALNIEQVVEPYIRGKAIRYLEEGKIVIFAAGTGNPFFTTDTAAALRGSEMGAEIVLKGTKVDGIYTADPKRDPSAQRYARISFDEAIARNLRVMDATALTLCRDQKLPISVFSIFKRNALQRVVLGEDEGTLVHVCSSSQEGGHDRGAEEDHRAEDGQEQRRDRERPRQGPHPGRGAEDDRPAHRRDRQAAAAERNRTDGRLAGKKETRCRTRARPRRSLPTARCPATSRSSWTATAAGPSGATCRASPD